MAASNESGPLNVPGGFVGPHTGAVTGNVAGYIQTPAPQVLSGDGAITIQAGDFSVFITKGSAAAITLAAPVAGAPGVGDDGKQILIFSETAFAHVVTCPVGFNRKNASGTATSSAAANNYLWLIARNGQYDVTGNVNFTLA